MGKQANPGLVHERLLLNASASIASMGRVTRPVRASGLGQYHSIVVLKQVHRQPPSRVFVCKKARPGTGFFAGPTAHWERIRQ